MTFYVATEGKPPAAFDTEDEANAHAKTLAGKPVIWELHELSDVAREFGVDLEEDL